MSRIEADGTNQTWSVTGVAGLDPGEEVRLGFHPDEKLRTLWGARPGLFLFNTARAGAPCDRVLVDLRTAPLWGERADWINTDRAPFDPTAELLFRDADVDGGQDLSGGMVTFISDGVREIPYASRPVDVLNLAFQSQRNNDTLDIWANSVSIQRPTRSSPGRQGPYLRRL